MAVLHPNAAEINSQNEVTLPLAQSGEAVLELLICSNNSNASGSSRCISASFSFDKTHAGLVQYPF